MKETKVSFQGESGAFSEVAARDFFAKKIKTIPCESFDRLFELVEKRKVDFGVIPIENSLIGSIHRNYDLLLEKDINVIGEHYLRINHCLIGNQKTTVKKISKVYSHPAALDQCRNFFDKNPQIAPISYYDTAGSVKMLAEASFDNAAAIASPFAAEIYKMKILRKNIEDETNNFTRFLFISKKKITVPKDSKTSIVFAMKNEPGVLYKVLSVFALRDIDLTKIESRPLRKKAWRYHFYLDFNGSINEDRIKNALNHLKEVTEFIKILGSYPKSKVNN